MCNVVSMSFHSHILIENWLIVCSWLSLCSLSCQPGGGPCKYQSRWQKVMKTNFWWDFFLSWKRYVGNNFWKWSGENSCRHIIPEKDVYQTVKMGDQAKNFVGKAQDARCRPISGGKGRCTDQTPGLAIAKPWLQIHYMDLLYIICVWWWHFEKIRPRAIVKPWLHYWPSYMMVTFGRRLPPWFRCLILVNL